MPFEDTQPGAESAPDASPVDVVKIEGDDSYISPSSAGRALSRARQAQAKTPEQPVDGAPPAAEQVTESPAQADDAAPEEVRSETQEADPAEVPPIEPPRSWTKEDKELFKSLPPETQQRVAERERSRESDFLRRQNESADKLKGLTAKEQQVEQARQQYESALPILLQNLHSAMAGEFADIKTMADVQRLANEDFPRYIRWDAQQKQVAAVQQEITSAQHRQATERQTKLSEYMSEESAKFVDRVPEFADEAQRNKLQSAAVSTLKDLGFKDDELGQLWRGEKEVSIHDHRLQLLIHDGVKYREMKAAAAKTTAKPLPPVQRPGVSRPKGAETEAQIQNLTKQLETASGNKAIRISADLQRARRSLAAR